MSEPRLRARRGFSLPELIVAMMVIVVGVLALASNAGGVLRQMRSGNQQALAAAVAQSRLEVIRSQSCASQSTTGSATTRGMSESWKLTALTSKIYSVAETVSYTPRAGVTKKSGFFVVIPCA